MKYFLVIVLLPLIEEGLVTVSVTSESMCTKRKSVVTLTDCLNMAIADDWDVKPQTK